MLQAVEETALWTCLKAEAITRLKRETTCFIEASPLLKGVYSPELVQIILCVPAVELPH